MAVLCNKYYTFALCTTLCSYHPLTSTVIHYLKTHVNMEYIRFFCKKKKSVVEEGESKTKFFLVTTHKATTENLFTKLNCCRRIPSV